MPVKKQKIGVERVRVFDERRERDVERVDGLLLL
jgi:hypothetical protein